MNKKTAFIFALCFTASVSGFLGTPAGTAQAEGLQGEHLLKAEGLIDIYSLSCACKGNTLCITATTSGNGNMAEIGVTDIVVEQSFDGENWEIYSTVPNNISEQTSMFSTVDKTLTVDGGRFYRVKLNHYAKEDTKWFPKTQSISNTSSLVYLAENDETAKYIQFISGNAERPSLNDTALRKLAAELGADTDYFSLPYIRKSVYLSAVDMKEAYLYTDESAELAAVNMLIHNKNIELADIQENAESIKDVSDDTKVRAAIRRKCEKFDISMLVNYMFKELPHKDKIPSVLAAAQSAYENGEYFLIKYRGLNPDFAPDTDTEYKLSLSNHTAVGIGIADGDWKFGEREFDKCILTLDPLNLERGNSAFSENTCIYINSATNDYYIPEYSDAEDSDVAVVALNMETFLSNDVSDCYNIRLYNANDTSSYTVTSVKDGVETVRSRENNYLDYFNDKYSYNGDIFMRADTFRIEAEGHSYEPSHIEIKNQDLNVEAEISSGKSVLEFDGRVYSVKGTYNMENIFPLGSENNDDFSLNYGDRDINFSGRIADGLKVEPAENSIFVEAEDMKKLHFNVYYKDTFDNFGDFVFISQKTELKYSKDGTIEFFIDKDKDGAFEHKIEKGDVNCDGFIDASDASAILDVYAALSTGDKNWVSTNLADYNNDSAIDATDASAVLAKYAELSTQN